MPKVHGSPVHVGSPEELGIADINRPDFGDAVEIRPGEVPVFWACGVTPQSAVMASRPAFAISHAPGYMFITDVPESSYREPAGDGIVKKRIPVAEKRARRVINLSVPRQQATGTHCELTGVWQSPAGASIALDEGQLFPSDSGRPGLRTRVGLLEPNEI